MIHYLIHIYLWITNCDSLYKFVLFVNAWKYQYIWLKYIFEILSRFGPSAFMLRTVHFHAWDRPLSCLGPSTFMLGTVHFHAWDRPLSCFGPSAYSHSGPSTFDSEDRPLSVCGLSTFVDRPLFVVLDRPLSLKTVHFWAFGPSTFTQLDRPLSPRTVHFHLDPDIWTVKNDKKCENFQGQLSWFSWLKI